MKISVPRTKQIFSTLIVLAVLLSATVTISKELPQTYTEPTTEMQFMLIPGGTFSMGSAQDKFAQPVHDVTVPTFYMGRFEVTFAQYEIFALDTKRDIPDDKGWGRGIRPVINVSWDDAVEFTKWLSKKTTRTFRLPSESEWEYAAKGGQDFYFPWGNSFGRSNANCAECGTPWDSNKTSPIGSFSANQFGLFDMAGNVYEWCLDTRQKSYEKAPTDGSAWIKRKNKEFRINRGGSWFQPAVEMRIYRRCWDRASQKRSELGFRVVLEP